MLDRWVELGNAGLVTGERLAQGLSAARDRLDTLKPGINSLSEAFEALGLKVTRSLHAKNRGIGPRAFDYIKANGGTVNELRAAWEKYGAARRAANGGILPDVLRLQDEMLQGGRLAKKPPSASAPPGIAPLTRWATIRGRHRLPMTNGQTDTAGRLIVGGSDASALAAQNTTSDEQAQDF